MLLKIFTLFALFISTTSNLIPNWSVENNTTRWCHGSWGTIDVQHNYATMSHDGSHSLRVQIFSLGIGDAKWVSAPILIENEEKREYDFTYNGDSDDSDDKDDSDNKDDDDYDVNRRNMRNRVNTDDKDDYDYEYDSNNFDDGSNYLVFGDYYRTNCKSTLLVNMLDDGSRSEWREIRNLAKPRFNTDWYKAVGNLKLPKWVTRIKVGHSIKGICWLYTDSYFSFYGTHPIKLTAPVGLSINFDDGWLSSFKKRSILEYFDICATYFIHPEVLGTGFGKNKYMTRGNIKTLHDSGHEIASHGLSHVDMTSLSDSDLTRHLNVSKIMLENMINDTVTGLSVPGGDVDNRVRLASSEFYSYLRTIEELINYQQEPYNIKSFVVTEETTLQNFYNILSDAEKYSVGTGNIPLVVLVYHKLNFRPDDTGTELHPDKFIKQMLYLKQSLAIIKPLNYFI